MATFAVHVVLSHEFVAVQFAPGDEVPEWAVGQVGAHCLVGDIAPVDVPDADDDPDPAPVVSADVPDFTKKPVRRTGR